MELEKIEYIRKSYRKPKRDDDGNIISKGNGAGRTKKGVMYCAVDPDSPETVNLGFSLCSSLDEFDYVNGIKEKGFGLDLAKARAEKWSDFTGFFIQKSWTEDEIENGDDLYVFENPDTTEIVEIPPSVIKPFRIFIQRCRRYYQDKEFPVWVDNIEEDNPVIDLDLIDVCEEFNDDDVFIALGDE